MYMQLINKYKIHNPHFENNLNNFYSLFSGKLSKKKNFTQTQQWMLFESFWMNTKKLLYVPSSWIISRALSNQNIIGLTNISIVLKPEPKRTTVCKRMEWVRGHFWNSSLMIGQKGQIWSTEKCFLRHFLVHTSCHTLWQNL